MISFIRRSNPMQMTSLASLTTKLTILLIFKSFFRVARSTTLASTLKCIFGIEVRKLLDLIISGRGRKIDHLKMHAMMEMLPLSHLPRSINS
jgi:hypothetical protein